MIKYLICQYVHLYLIELMRYLVPFKMDHFVCFHLSLICRGKGHINRLTENIFSQTAHDHVPCHIMHCLCAIGHKQLY